MLVVDFREVMVAVTAVVDVAKCDIETYATLFYFPSVCESVPQCYKEEYPAIAW